MPELPEAETIARQLHARLAGERLGEVRAVREDMVHGTEASLAKSLPGLRVERVERRAKRVILVLSGPADLTCSLVFGLGMTGRVTVNAESDPVEKHTHLRVAIAGRGDELRFRDPRRFGGIWLLSNVECGLSIENNPTRRQAKSWKGATRGLSPVGPEPLEIKPGEFARLLARKRSIKSLLMDQSIIAGLGNIYCDESLFAAGIHPLRPACSLNEDEAKRLVRSIKTVLRRAIRFNGSTFMDYRGANGEAGSFQRFHKVYGCGGEPCRVCGTTIKRIIVSGRSTCFCPVCQPKRPGRGASERTALPSPARRKS